MRKLKFLTLAALVVFPLWACDEGDEGTVAPPVTGSITGSVTIDGTGVSGVTVTLSNGTTATTGATGSYTISSVPAGAYTVTISGYASDATFATTSQAATIATSGQVVTVDFPGNYIRTSSIVGQVTGGGVGLAGVTVTLSGGSTGTSTTDVGGQYSFTGLRAGSYTVTISGYDAVAWTFAATSTAATLTSGQSKVVAFNGTPTSTASIGGVLFVDENDKNDVWDGAVLEDQLAAPNVAITLEGPEIGNLTTVQTDANGAYAFPGLPAGDYNLAIASTDTDIPANFVFGLASNTTQITLTAGSAYIYNYPFDIINQDVMVYAFLGTDGGTMTAPVEGVTVDLYDTEAGLTALSAASVLATATTGSDGGAKLTYARADDSSPSGSPDNIVFANVTGGPAGFQLQSDAQMEISFASKDAVALAPDTVDYLNTGYAVGVRVYNEVSGDDEAGYNVIIRAADSTNANLNKLPSGTDGWVYFTGTTNVNLMPRDYYFLLGQGGQTANNGHAFQVTPEDVEGVVAGKYLKWSHDGTTLTTDTIFVGRNAIMYLDADIMARVHHELDDSTDVPTFTGGDETSSYGAGNPVVSLWRNDTLQAAASPTSAAAGYVTFANQMTGEDYKVTFAATGPRDALTDTMATVPDLDGGSQSVRVCPLGDDTAADCGTFAFKFNNHTISGTLAAADATPAAGIHVNIMPTADNIQPNITDTTVTTTAGGVYTLTGLREGPYTITPADSVTADGTVWTFVAQPDTVVDAEGVSATTTWNTTPAFMATEIQGVVVNDRDLDTNTIDGGEALVGVELNLYRGGSVDEDSLETTVATDANGAYTFDWLPEATYTVERVATTEANVLRALVSGSSFTVTTAAAVAPTWGGNNTRRIGHTAPRPLPAWDYDNSVVLNARLSMYTFLFGDGEIGGTAHLNGDTSTKIDGLTMYLRRCNVSVGSASPPVPVAAGCTTYISTTPSAETVTATDGTFSFTGLEEGVYEVISSPITAGYGTDNTGKVLFIINGAGDVEVYNSFKVS